MKSPADNADRNIVIAINDVEIGLVLATQKLSKTLGRRLELICLTDAKYHKSKKQTDKHSKTYSRIIVDFSDKEKIREIITRYSDRILLVTCRMERSIQFFAKVIPLLPDEILLPSVKSLKLCTEKEHMREALNSFNQNLGPKALATDILTDDFIAKAKKELDFPVITKPSGLALSLLVNECKNSDELRAVLAKSFDFIDHVYRKNFGRGNRTMLVEEKMSGVLYSVDAYVDNTGDVQSLPLIRLVTAEQVGKPGFYCYSTNTYTEDLTGRDIKDAEKTTKNAIDALGLRNSTAHVELIKTVSGWKIIELGPRMGGFREDMYRESYRINHYYNDLLNRIGLKPELPEKLYKYSERMIVYAEAEGMINSISGLDELRQLDSFNEINQHLSIGDEAKFSNHGGHFVFDVMLSNEDKHQLKIDVVKARELIQIEVTD